jgi:hypothetical protein
MGGGGCWATAKSLRRSAPASPAPPFTPPARSPAQVPQGQGYVLGSHKGHGISCTQPAGYIISGELNKGFWNPTATRD